MTVIVFPKRRHGRASAVTRGGSIDISRSSEMSGNARMISGQASRGNWLRCFHARTAPGRLPTAAANAAGPPFWSISSEAVGIDMPYPLPKVTYKGKRIITHGNVAVGNVPCMSAPGIDDGWKGLSEPWERLRWARERWQRANDQPLSTETAAAAVGMKGGTYRAYEGWPGRSKHTTMGHDDAQRFAAVFRVRWIWLLLGEGSPFSDLSPDEERVLRAMRALPPTAQKTLGDVAETMAQPTPQPPQRAARYRQ